MEVTSTIEINGEEREIADAYARGNINSLNNNLSQLEIDLKMLGYTVPKECPIQNSVNGNQFVQSVGRIDLGTLDWNYHENSGSFYTVLDDGKKTGVDIGVDCYLYGYECYKENAHNIGNNQVSVGSSFVSTYVCSLVIKDTSYTDTTTFKNAMKGVYLYYELETEQTIKVDGNEAVTKINDSLSVIGKCKNQLNPTLATTTSNGVTCTANGDGTYTLSGTSTNACFFDIFTLDISKNIGKTFKVIGCPPNGSASTYDITFTDNISTSSSLEEYGNGAIKTIEQFGESNWWHGYIRVRKGVTVDNLVFKPMITENLNATYDDFVPYTGDGDTLTADVAELKSDLSEKLKVISISLEGVTVKAQSIATVELPQEYQDAGYIIASILTASEYSVQPYEISGNSIQIKNKDSSDMMFVPTATVKVLIAKIG